MDESKIEYIVMNLRDNMLSIPSLVETEVETKGDTFESRGHAQEFIREQTGLKPEESDLQVCTLSVPLTKSNHTHSIDQ